MLPVTVTAVIYKALPTK